MMVIVHLCASAGDVNSMMIYLMLMIAMLELPYMHTKGIPMSPTDT